MLNWNHLMAAVMLVCLVLCWSSWLQEKTCIVCGEVCSENKNKVRNSSDIKGAAQESIETDIIKTCFKVHTFRESHCSKREKVN